MGGKMGGLAAYGIPAVGRNVFSPGDEVACCVVDEHVDGAILFHHAVHRLLHRIGIANVERTGCSLASRGFDGRHDLVMLPPHLRPRAIRSEAPGWSSRPGAA